MNRTQCVICCGTLGSLYTLPSVPITCSPARTPLSEDILQDMGVGVCDQCGCVQLKTLIDPTVLYSESHNATANTPTWKEHHTWFAEFVRSHGCQSLIEIGGSSGSLYQHLPSEIDYTCMDMCEPSVDIPKFIRANCETYEFPETECICMSHVFEHLYTPRKFLAQISKKVRRVILSIPNMNHLLTIRSSSIVFNEHTYFLDKHNVEWLFAQYGYTLTRMVEYKSHSLFLSFEKTENIPVLALENRRYISEQMLAIASDMNSRFSNVNVVPNSFLVPGGHMGQLLYSALRPTNLLGFLDNDQTKQGRRVYGTPYSVFPFSAICDIEHPTVYLYAGVYTDEIVAQLKNLQKSVIIHIL